MKSATQCVIYMLITTWFVVLDYKSYCNTVRSTIIGQSVHAAVVRPLRYQQEREAFLSSTSLKQADLDKPETWIDFGAQGDHGDWVADQNYHCNGTNSSGILYLTDEEYLVIVNVKDDLLQAIEQMDEEPAKDTVSSSPSEDRKVYDSWLESTSGVLDMFVFLEPGYYDLYLLFAEYDEEVARSMEVYAFGCDFNQLEQHFDVQEAADGQANYGVIQKYSNIPVSEGLRITLVSKNDTQPPFINGMVIVKSEVHSAVMSRMPASTARHASTAIHHNTDHAGMSCSRGTKDNILSASFKMFESKKMMANPSSYIVSTSRYSKRAYKGKSVTITETAPTDSILSHTIQDSQQAAAAQMESPGLPETTMQRANDLQDEATRQPKFHIDMNESSPCLMNIEYCQCKPVAASSEKCWRPFQMDTSPQVCRFGECQTHACTCDLLPGERPMFCSRHTVATEYHLLGDEGLPEDFSFCTGKPTAGTVEYLVSLGYRNPVEP